ncbi:DUF2637 domain-containing protein [Streptomyces scabiei]|uniref:DUF2637 domain-containing protein n=1 Tax=Streptomyces scabiei TaxID=1930 RepID=UPI0029B34B26|nr:DUF2637 domain-containing protein [Streptomyces scabiei]MDX2531594.1 DUF2637 domain-containing protein [Streptomyces scabiei]MDX2796652.1 DUF2637 domain-containing protein [Streptomyces scabiei]MDX2856159.1 DUF2637 domain-containing protein [Streptomyces scabiei]MDX3824560.1 DUF2637 domain-containing protein [Streptomyces scabiei]
MTAWDRSAIILLGAAGFAFSYDALRQIAIAIHARESLSYLFPVFIEGFIAYGVRAIVLLRHQRFGARLYAWFLFLAATGASLGANALHAITLNTGPQAGRSALHLTDGVVGVLSTLAPLALAGSVHLYILMARTAELSVPDGADNGPGPVRREVSTLEEMPARPVPRPLGTTATAETRSLPARPSVAESTAGNPVDLQKHGADQTGDTRTNRPEPGSPAGADGADGNRPGLDGLSGDLADRGAGATVSAVAPHSAPAAVPAPPDGEESSVPDSAESPQDREADDEWLTELLPIARAASEKAGRISRDAVKEAVRAHQAISNDRLGVLLARLKEEEEATAKTPAGASSALW